MQKSAKWVLDPSHTKVGFSVRHFGISETREIFEANFFGTLKLTQSFLPMLRQQKSGHIIQMSSHGGVWQKS